MSRTFATATAILTILHCYYASAQTATCLPGLSDWSFNSLGQSPCDMMVPLGAVCSIDGSFTVPPLSPGEQYIGPSQPTDEPCKCNTVFYSLLCACAYCQVATFINWSVYSFNCTITYNQVIPYPIPSSIVVPHYAYLDVETDNTFDVTEAMTAGGPESSPVPQSTSSTNPIATSTPTSVASTTTSAAPTTTSAASTTTSVAATSEELNVGAIVGGVIGGVALIVILIIAGIFGAFTFLRRHNRFALTPSTYSAQAMMNGAG